MKDLPIQTCITIVDSKPSSQSQAKLPGTFLQVPFPQTEPMIEHSLMSKNKNIFTMLIIDSFTNKIHAENPTDALYSVFI